MWQMGPLFIKISPVKQFSYENDFSGVVDALHQSFSCRVIALISVNIVPSWDIEGGELASRSLNEFQCPKP